MQITVVLPHAEQRNTAGVRIRYDRIATHLERMGHSLTFALIDDMATNKTATSDVYLLCKCQDVRSILLARSLQAQRRRVGIDIFDDYFSQSDDNRFTHLRDWLHQITRHLSFILCATDAMSERLAAIVPQLPLLVMNDPFDAFDAASLAGSLVARADAARRTSQVDVAWFGMGDNSYFPVGLDDLCATGEMLTGFRRHGFEPRLHVLTNRRAMTAERLEKLAKLPLSVRLAEWTTERETALLRSSLVAFLPVNAQPFSTAKSLNRGVTALSNGAQLLSAGYPLYAALNPFVYRSVDILAQDLVQDRLKLAPETLPTLNARFDSLATPEKEARQLADFLTAILPSHPSDRAKSIAVIHGTGSVGPQHKYVQRSKMYSVAGPFQNNKLKFDLRFEIEEGGGVAVVLSERMARLLSPELSEQLQPHSVVGKITFLKLPLEGSNPFGPVAVSVADKLAGYATGMTAARELVAGLFPRLKIILSEMSPPFRSDALPRTEARNPVDA